MSNSFFEGLPRVESENFFKLKARLTLHQVYTALVNLKRGTAPRVYGLPIEFYKSFWSVIGEDVLDVATDSSELQR